MKPNAKAAATTSETPATKGLVPLKPELFETITALSHKAAGAAANVTAENIERAAELLARVRQASKELDAVHKAAVAQLKTAMAPFDADKRSNMKSLDEVDGALCKAILKLVESTDIKRVEGVLGSSISVVERKSYTLNPDSVTIIDTEDGCIVRYPINRSLITDPIAAVDMVALTDGVTDDDAPPYLKQVVKRHLTTRAAEVVE